MSELVEVKLANPIEHGSELVEVVSFRKMTAADLNKCGYPVMITDADMYIPIPMHISALIARCGSLPPSVVAKFSAKDFNACMAVLMGFLGEEEAG